MLCSVILTNMLFQPEELPLNDMAANSSQIIDGQVLSPGRQHSISRPHRPPIGGVPIFPPGTVS